MQGHRILGIALVAGALAWAPVAQAEEAAPAAVEPAVEAAAEATDAAASPAAAGTPGEAVAEPVAAVGVGAAVADYAVQCTKRAAAMNACDQMGGLKAMGCKKVAAIKFKGAVCPEL